MQMSRRPPRRFPRVSSERPILVRLLSEPRQHEQLARTRVIGLGGLMFVSNESLGFGSLMEILISLGEVVAKTDARVVYEIPKSSHEIEVGVEFLRVSPPDRERVEALVLRGGTVH